MTLVPREVPYPGTDLEAARFVRNACRAWMTGNQTFITPEAQEAWWDLLDPTANHLYVYSVLHATVGYGLIRKHLDGAWMVSGGLLENARSRGLGADLFGHLVSEVEKRGGEAWLEVLGTNLRAQSLYKRLGFVEVDRAERQVAGSGIHDVITMRKLAEGRVID